MNGKTLVPTILVVVLAGCGTGGPVFVEQPTVKANPNPAVPLAAVLEFTADQPVSSSISVSDGNNKWTLEYDESHNPADGLAVVGMRPDRRHEIRLTIRDAGGDETAVRAALEFTTPPLPKGEGEFPPVNVTVSQTEKMEPGFRVFNPRRRKSGDPKFGANFGMLLAVDAAGETIWYYRTDSRISDLERLENGHFLFITQDYRVVEIDMLGNVVAQWYAAGRPLGPVENALPIETLAVHHEVDELPNGNLIVLGAEIREVGNYYTSEYDANAPRKQQKVMGDEIIEFTRDGKEVWRWKAFDYMDPFRIGYETFSDYWVRRGFPETVDWSHANGLMYNPGDDSILVNYRYQAAAMKIDRKTKQIKWIIGEPSGWGDLEEKLLKANGDMRWFYHQHAPQPTPNGTLLIFDNGNYRTRPFTPPLPPKETYSRAVEYAIDEETGTVEQVWESEGPGEDSVISFAMGDVDWMPETGNILVHYGMVIARDDVPKFNWTNASRLRSWTRIREYARTTPAEVIWEVVLGDPSGGGEVTWALFGGDLMSALVP